MSFTKGDVVRVGKRGTVEYTWIGFYQGDDAVSIVESTKTGRATKHDTDKLILVKAAEDEKPTTGQLMAEANTVAPLVGTVAPLKDESTSYQKAILRALNVLGKHVYGGTAKNRTKRARAKVAKKARRNARKAKTARFVEISNAEGK